MQINGISTNTTSCKVSIADLSSEQSGRDLRGIMHKDIIRTTRQLDCTWGIMSWKDEMCIRDRIIPVTKFPLTSIIPEKKQKEILILPQRLLLKKEGNKSHEKIIS